MPLVRVRYNQWFHEVDNLNYACREIVPAELCTEKGRLTPGSIEFFAEPQGRADEMTTDVFVDIEACWYDDREPAEAHSTNIHAALKQLFPGITFAVWVKLVNAGWASDSDDPEFNGDMSMEAAIKRAHWTLTELRTTS